MQVIQLPVNPPRAGVRVSESLMVTKVFTLTPLIPPRIDWKLPPQHCSALSPRIHWIRYPKTCCASNARLALPHAGAFDVRLSATMPDRVLGRSGTA